MALGGVDTGSMNAKLAPNAAPIAGGIGLTLAAILSEMTTVRAFP